MQLDLGTKNECRVSKKPQNSSKQKIESKWLFIQKKRSVMLCATTD